MTYFADKAPNKLAEDRSALSTPDTSSVAKCSRLTTSGQITYRGRLHEIPGLLLNTGGRIWGHGFYTQGHRTAIADFTNRFVWYRCRCVRAWGSRPSRRRAPVLACRYTP